jgi:pimeloyl-ACP methyl ester carboxylesterase
MDARGTQRFHLVGHDWGGSLAWLIADRWPERLASLTMLSRPHPASFARALAMPDGEQAYRSRHHREFLDPAAGPRLLADDAAWLRARLARNGVPEAAIAAHLSVIGSPPAMEAALAWYRARGERQPVGPTKVPSLFIWGDADDTVGQAAAEGTGEFIAADYQFAVLPGVGHYAADQVPERVTALLLDHRPSPGLTKLALRRCHTIHRRHKSLVTPSKAGAHREDRSRPARLSANPPDRPIRRPRESGDPGPATEIPRFPRSRERRV